MKQFCLPRGGCALLLAVSLLFTSAVPVLAADASSDYPVGGISQNGYLIDDDDNYVDFDEAVTGPAADSDLRVPYGKTIYFPLHNDGTESNVDDLREDWEREKTKLAEFERKVQETKAAYDALADAASQVPPMTLNGQPPEAEPSLKADAAKKAVALLDELMDKQKRLAEWREGSPVDSGDLKQSIAACIAELEDYGITVTADTDLTREKRKLEAALRKYAAREDLARANERALSLDQAKLAWQEACTARDAQKKVTDLAKAAYDKAAGGTDLIEGYPFVHESDAVRHVKIKSDWDEGKSYIDSLSITKKRYKNSPHAAPSGAKKYAYFLAIEVKDRDSTSASTRDASGTINLKKTSGEDRFDYEDVELDIDFEIGFNHPEDANVIPIDPALFEPDEDFDQGTDEEFEFEADDDSYYVANTKSQKKLALGLNTDYDDEIGDRYEYAELTFWNGNGASFNRSGYLYLYADEDDYLYSIDKHDDLTLLHADYDNYDDCFVIRTRTLGRYAVSDRRLREVGATTEDNSSDITVIYDVDTGVNYNPTTGGWGAPDDELWTAPAPANTAAIDHVLTRDGMLARPETAQGAPASEAPVASSEEISATPTALTGTNPPAPPAPLASAPREQGMGRNTLILLCVLAAELTIALTSLVCYFTMFRRKNV